jgi:hypothetical protein
VGKAGKKNTPKDTLRAKLSKAAEEPALEEARQRLRFLHRLGALDDDPRVRARKLVMMIEFPVGFIPLGGIEKLREHLLQLLSEKRAAPGAKKGRPAKLGRDFWIVQVLARLVAMCSVPLTRRRRRADDVRPRRLSACAIVAQTLGELGIKLNEAGVEAIWSKRRPQRSASEIDEHSSLPRSIEPDRRGQEIIDAAIKEERRSDRTPEGRGRASAR